MIYNEGNEVVVPNLDLLTLLFESEHCRTNEDTPIFAEAKDPGRYITKARARELSKQFAFFLRQHYGIGAAGPEREDVVVTVSTGQSALPCLFYGVVAADGIYSAASHSSTVGDLARQIRAGHGKVLVCSRDLAKLAAESARNAGLPERNVLVLESHPDVKLSSIDGSVVCDFKGSLTWRRVTHREELEKSKICILYSSGTTGLPKGVLLSHMNLVSNVCIGASINRPVYDEEARQGNPFHRRTLAHLPAAHIAGVMGYFVVPFFEGGIVFWMPTFNFDDFLRYCGELEVNGFFTVPPIYVAIAKHPAVKDQFKHVRSAISGAAPLTGELQRAASERMGLDRQIVQTWGLSETTGSATTVSPGEDVKMGSLGKLMPNTLLRLVDDDERDVKPGEPGEALIKSPIVTQGYHNNPEANKTAFTQDGWFRTGDILRMEGDDLYVVDRKKELIKYKGLQVAPAELEGLISSHPGVSDAAVIGISQSSTEVPRAYVVRAASTSSSSGNALSEEDVVEFVRSHVADYNRLRGGVAFVDAIPRSPAGKILRKEVKEMRKREERQARL